MKKKLVLVWVLVLLLVSGVGYVYFFLPIRKIDCVTQYADCSEETFGYLKSLQGGGFRKVKKEIISYLKEKNLGEFVIIRSNIDSVRVNLVVIKAYALISDKEDTWVVDKDGKILGIGRKGSLPTVVIDTERKDWKLAIEIINLISREYGVNEGVLKDDSFVVMVNGLKVDFPVTGAGVEVISELKLILSQLNSLSTETKIKEIDLRFKNPVVR